MRLFVGTGRIARVETRAVKGTSMTLLSVPLGGKTRTENGEWENVPEKTLWCELAAFDEAAQDWAERFAKGDLIEFSGTPELRAYLRSDGTPAAALRIRCGRYGVRKISGTSDEPPF
jgi:single-stranded DNA-binding protein